MSSFLKYALFLLEYFYFYTFIIMLLTDVHIFIFWKKRARFGTCALRLLIIYW